MNTSVRISQQTSQAQKGTAIAGLKTLSDTNETRMASAADQIYFQRITFFGIKALTGTSLTANVGSVYFGVVTGKLPITIGAGGEYSYTVPVGQKEDLYNIFVQAATANDGVYYIAY